MKSMKLNISVKYKNNKFQIKYLKAKKNNIVLFAVYTAEWDEEDGIFYRAYKFFIYFNRKKRAVHYIGNNSAYQCYGFNFNNNMNSFQRNADRVLNEINWQGVINNEHL